MGTALKYQEELDFSKPLTEQWGARFLTEQEVKELAKRMSLSDYEHIAMNLEHLHHDQEAADEDLVAIAHADLVALLDVARDLQSLAERSERLAKTIDDHAWDLWTTQREQGYAR